MKTEITSPTKYLPVRCSEAQHRWVGQMSSVATALQADGKKISGNRLLSDILALVSKRGEVVSDLLKSVPSDVVSALQKHFEDAQRRALKGLRAGKAGVKNAE